jgi:nucleotide-binding universal stress UspA family protein
MRHINRILCPVDLSDTSKHTFEHASLIARWYDATVTVLHVCNPLFIPSGEFTVGGPIQAPQLTDDEIEEVREEVLREVLPANAANVSVIVESGSPWIRILEHAKKLPADLIVLGTHGLSGFQHLLLGSVTEKVIRRAPCPVMTVPPGAQTTSRLPFKRLLCPVDFSDSSLAALEFALSLAQEGDAQLTILNVAEWPDDTVPPTAEYRKEREGALAKKLDALIPESVRVWCQVTPRLVHGKSYEEILATAASDDADVIVMGVHGRNALDLMLFGSTTNQVVRRATCPVLTIRR